MKLGISAAATSILVLVAALAAQPVQAQPRPAVSAQPAQGGIVLTPQERTALAPVSQAVMMRNWPAAAAALPAAQAAAQSPGARYAVGRFELAVGVGTINSEQQLRGIDRILSSGVAPQVEVAALLRHQAQLYNERREYERAENSLSRLAQLTPNDPEALAMLAQIHRTRNNSGQALAMLHRSLEAGDAAGQRAPESRYKLSLALALQSDQRERTADLARRLVAAYPSAVNWRDALLSYRDVAQPDAALNVDIVRLMRASGALAGERDYLTAVGRMAGTELSTTNATFGPTVLRGLAGNGLAGEAKEILDEGVTRGMLEATDPLVRSLRTGLTAPANTGRTGLAARVTQARSAAAGAAARTAADALFGYGRYAEAAEMYRLALTKGGEDSALVNSRLGAALTLAGQPAEAQAALHAVTGPRAELARLWLTLLVQRPASPPST